MNVYEKRYMNMYQTGDGLKSGGVFWETSREARRVHQQHRGALIPRLVVSITPKPGYRWSFGGQCVIKRAS